MESAESMKEVKTEITDEERKLLEAFKKLDAQPEIENPEDLVRFMSKYRCREKAEGGARPTGVVRQDEERTFNSSGYPRISTFGGDSSKGEASWVSFKFEVESLVEERIFKEEQILFGIRKAAKGDVADILRRLGTRVSIREVMRKLECTYGNVETRETILRKFYNCTQETKETITSYAARLEDLYEQATAVNGLAKDDTMLKGVLFQGLRKELRHQATYKYETERDYDKFKIYLRKMESEEREDKAEKPCKPAVPTERNEMGQVLSELRKLNDRIDKLEKERATGQPENQYTPFISRGARRGHTGFGGGFQPQHRGFRETRSRGPSRPLATNTFMPTCYNCSQRGHMARECPN